MRTLLLAAAASPLLLAGPARAADLPPGTCPADGADGLRAALARSDAGEGPAADLDLAACYRALLQEVPEAAALGRALDAGLPENHAGLVRARLDAIGWPPAGETEDGPGATVAEASAPSPAAGVDPLWAYILGGTAVATLVGATAAGFVALDADADGGDALPPGIAAAVCAGIGVAAGIAAVVLWPDEEVAPTSGPGEVGVGVLVRF